MQDETEGELWIGSGLGWPERNFGVTEQLCDVGACFKALDESTLTAPSVPSCIFYHPNLAIGTMCDIFLQTNYLLELGNT